MNKTIRSKLRISDRNVKALALVFAGSYIMVNMALFSTRPVLFRHTIPPVWVIELTTNLTVFAWIVMTPVVLGAILYTNIKVFTNYV